MSAVTYHKFTSFYRQRIEALFLLSPLAVLFIGIFNIADSKSILSRLIPIVGVYCLCFYRDALKQNWQTKRIRPFVVASILAFFYFGFAHLFRGDEFGYSRTLVTCLAYLLFVPWTLLSRQYFARILSLAAIFCGLNAIYEYWGLGIQRVGIATNPIPYALFCALMVLSSLHQLLKAKSRIWRVTSMLGVALAGIAVVLTDVRGVIVFLPVVMVFMVLRTIRPSPHMYLASLLSVALLCGLGFVAFENKIEQRIEVTKQEFSKIAAGNFDTSIGIRLTLWLQAKETFLNFPVIGVGDEALREEIKALPIRGAAVQHHIHNQYLDTLSRYGALGLFVLLAWLVSPLFYTKSQNRLGIQVDPLLSSMILMIALAGLTDVPFHHTHLVYLFTLFTGAWLIMPAKECNETAQTRLLPH